MTNDRAIELLRGMQRSILNGVGGPRSANHALDASRVEAMDMAVDVLNLIGSGNQSADAERAVERAGARSAEEKMIQPDPSSSSPTPISVAQVTISREAAEDALQHAWNAGVVGAWRCVREKFAKGEDVQAWALAVEKQSAPVAAEWQQARDLIGLTEKAAVSASQASHGEERKDKGSCAPDHPSVISGPDQAVTTTDTDRE